MPQTPRKSDEGRDDEPTEAPTGVVRPIIVESVGGSIGPYRLLQVLGEGGFGIVYLAERREPFVQRVALKVIKPGMDSRAVLSRFEQERQALALMSHPNVAKVLDGGLSPGGRPYFVMEYVKGEPITTYCDRHQLTIRERLELFIPVCEAVQHAHMKGIIHRDLKPSNILVSVVDSGGAAAGAPRSAAGGGESESGVHGAVVKVIDFGVAKAIAPGLSQHTVFTEQGTFIGTPEYMSPEQAEMGATDIDTRADVYSLGVILYELLTGSLPFDTATLRAGGYEAIQKIIREADPPRPSTRLTANGEQAAECARRRQTQAESLARVLRRELEWIPLRAMRKDRTRRYETALELARDIRRYLEGQALQAGPESTTYRVGKFLRRNRRAAGAIGSIVGALAVGLAVTSVALVKVRRANFEIEAARKEALAEAQRATVATKEARDQLARANMEADRASQERARAVQVARFMSGLLSRAGQGGSVIDSGLQPGSGAVLRDMLEHATERIEGGELADMAPAELSLRLTIGETWRSLGESARAERVLSPAVDMAGQLGDRAAEADALEALAAIREDRGQLEAARSGRSRALDFRRVLAPSDTASSRLLSSGLAGAISRSSGVELEANAPRRDRVNPADAESLVLANAELATRYLAEGKHDQAVKLFREALEIDRRGAEDGVHPAVARRLRDLAAALVKQGNPEDAAAARREAEGIETALAERRAALGRSLHLYGCLLSRMDLADEAEAALNEAITVRRSASGSPRDVAFSEFRLGALLYRRGREAESASRLLAAVEKLLTLESAPATARDALIELARGFERAGEMSEAAAANEALAGETRQGR